VLLLLYAAASLLLVCGATSAERKEQEALPSQYSLAFEGVVFEARGGGPELIGWYLPSPDGDDAVIFVHGIGGVRSGDNALAIAKALVDDGISVLLFDLRAHGSSRGERVSAGYFEKDDALGAYDYLMRRPDAPSAVGLLGFSMGGGIAVLAAAEEPRIEALVVDSPFADVSDLIAHEAARKTPFPESVVPAFIPGARLLAELLYGIDIGSLKPERAVTSLAYPVLVIHGDADERIPVAHGRRIAAAAPNGSVLWEVTGAGHVDSSTVAPEEYKRRVIEYFRQRLRG
jgi:fermentation-respiration switch protein FrsA (DUF1100 family)